MMSASMDTNLNRTVTLVSFEATEEQLQRFCLSGDAQLINAAPVDGKPDHKLYALLAVKPKGASEDNHRFRLTGEVVCWLMRQYKVQIRTLAKEHGITQKRVREVRKNGVTGFAANEWHWFITGCWLDGHDDHHRD